MAFKSFRGGRPTGFTFPGDPRPKQNMRRLERKEKKTTVGDLIGKAIVKCWKEDKRHIVTAIAVINMITAWCGIAWLWFSDDSPSPPFLGFSWWSEVRAMLLPESTVSCGHCFFLFHGSVQRKQIAVLLSALCQAMQTIGSILFFIFYAFHAMFVDWRVLLIILSYTIVRSFVLYVTAKFNQELCKADEERREEESKMRMTF